MTTDARRLTLIASTSMAASAWSHGIYWKAIVPRMPGWQSVPSAWWVLEYAPLVVVLVATGFLCTGGIRVPIYALAFIIPPLLIEAARGVITGEPIMHDAWVGDIDYWVQVSVRVVMCMGFVGAVYSMTSIPRLGRDGA